MLRKPVLLTPLPAQTRVDWNSTMLLECKASNVTSVRWYCDGEQILPEDDGVKIVSEGSNHKMFVGKFSFICNQCKIIILLKPFTRKGMIEYEHDHYEEGTLLDQIYLQATLKSECGK